MKHIILFDMDGVLVDVSMSYRRAIQLTVERFTGDPVTDAQIQAYKDRGGFNNDWILTSAMIEERGVSVSLEDSTAHFQELYSGNDWSGLISQEPFLLKSATLHELQDRFRFGVATGRPAAEAGWTLEKNGFQDAFETVVSMEMQGDRGKPDPFPLLLALENMAATTELVWYVGDTVDDMVAAKKAGATAIGCLPPGTKPDHRDTLIDAGADLVINSVNDLPSVLNVEPC